MTDDQYIHAQELTHSQSRLKNQELLSDKPGHYQTSHKSHGQFISSLDPHKEEHIRFAKTIIDNIQNMNDKSSYQYIILCAEPYFYGILKQFLSKSNGKWSYMS